MNTTKQFSILAAVGLCLLLGSAARIDALVVTVPTDLNPGDQYRLVFVTSTTTTATSTDINTYNTFVNDLAITAGLDTIAGTVEGTTTWTAIGSTATVDAIDNTSTTGTGVPIYLLNDTQIATSYTDLWDGTIAASIDITEEGNFNGTNRLWAGTEGNGTANSNPLGSATPRQGNPTREDVADWWIDRINDQSNTFSHEMYAISGVLTVIPEPSTILLFCMGGWVLYAASQRFRRR